MEGRGGDSPPQPGAAHRKRVRGRGARGGGSQTLQGDRPPPTLLVTHSWVVGGAGGAWDGREGW